MKDLTGYETAYYKVLKPVLQDNDNYAKDSGKRILWECQCKNCGKIRIISSNNIRTSKCDCYVRAQTLKKLQTAGLGRLKIIEFAYKKNNSNYWKCVCSCGNIAYVKTSDLLHGVKRSCGCLQKEHSKRIGETLLTKDMLGKEIDDWIIIEKVPKPSNVKRDGAYWKLRCKICGEEKNLAGTDIRRRKHMFCTKKSIIMGETIVSDLLTQNDISFQREKSFEGLTGSNNGLLRFDFAVYNFDGKLDYLIEIQGDQHYKPIDFYGGEKVFLRQQAHDKLKQKYCIEHNIPLLQIPSRKQSQLTINDLLLETSPYIFKEVINE